MVGAFPPPRSRNGNGLLSLEKKMQLVNKNFMTEAEAEKYKDEYHFGWAERIMRTVTEEES